MLLYDFILKAYVYIPYQYKKVYTINSLLTISLNNFPSFSPMNRTCVEAVKYSNFITFRPSKARIFNPDFFKYSGAKACTIQPSELSIKPCIRTITFLADATTRLRRLAEVILYFTLPFFVMTSMFNISW